MKETFDFAEISLSLSHESCSFQHFPVVAVVELCDEKFYKNRRPCSTVVQLSMLLLLSSLGRWVSMWGPLSQVQHFHKNFTQFRTHEKFKVLEKVIEINCRIPHMKSTNVNIQHNFYKIQPKQFSSSTPRMRLHAAMRLNSRRCIITRAHENVLEVSYMLITLHRRNLTHFHILHFLPNESNVCGCCVSFFWSQISSFSLQVLQPKYSLRLWPLHWHPFSSFSAVFCPNRLDISHIVKWSRRILTLRRKYDCTVVSGAKRTFNENQ